MSDHDDEIAKLERKNELMSRLVETLERKIELSDKEHQQHQSEVTMRDQEIQRLERELDTERRRPMQLTTPTPSNLSQDDIHQLSAAELLIYAEKKRIRWGY